MLPNLFCRHEHIETKSESLNSLPKEKLYQHVIQPLRHQTKENEYYFKSSLSQGFKGKQADIQVSTQLKTHWGVGERKKSVIII